MRRENCDDSVIGSVGLCLQVLVYGRADTCRPQSYEEPLGFYADLHIRQLDQLGNIHLHWGSKGKTLPLLFGVRFALKLHAHVQFSHRRVFSFVEECWIEAHSSGAAAVASRNPHHVACASESAANEVKAEC